MTDPSKFEDAKDQLPLLSKRNHSYEDTLPIVVLELCVGAYIFFAIINRHWFRLFGQLAHLPPFQYRAFDLHGVVEMIAVTAGVAFFGAVFTPFIIRKPPPMVERILWTGIASCTFVSLVTILLAIFGHLYVGTLLATLVGAFAFFALTVRLLSGRASISFILKWWRTEADLTTLGSFWLGSKLWRRISIAYLVLTSVILIFHSITTPITDYDALIYHAAMAKILVHAHGMPFIVGPSPGLEMSANYPPMFPALGAFTLLFTHGNDIFLRALAPVAAIAMTGAAYAIGRRFGGTMLGLLAAVFTLTAQIVSLYAVFDTVYTFMGLFVAMAFLALITYVSDHSIISLALLGASIGLLFLCSYQAAIVCHFP